MQDWPEILLNFPGSGLLLGLSLGLIGSRLVASRRPTPVSKPLDQLPNPLRQAQDDLTRLQARYQILESSHQTLQGDLSQERSVLMSLHAELARERSLRLNLELALETVRRERVTPSVPPTATAPVAAQNHGIRNGTALHGASEATGAPGDDPQTSDSIATQALKELLQPINSELRAVRRELEGRRDTPHGDKPQPMASVEKEAREPERTRNVPDSVAPVPSRHASKAARELDNFFRRIQVDPSAAQSAAPGIGSETDPD